MARIILKGANLLDGVNPTRPESTVVVDGERIAHVLQGDGPEPAPGDRVVELAGRTVMPGMICCHYHSTYDNITIQPEPLGLERPPGYLTLVAANHLRDTLMAGFTGVVSAGAIPAAIDPQLKLAIENGVIEGPRFVPGSLGLDTTGDYNDSENWWWHLGNHGAQRFCDGPDEFRKAVRQEIKRGAEIIKIFASGGHGIAEESNTRGLSSDELQAAVQAAHERGKKIRVHCAWRNMILECVRTGVDVIDHGDEMDAECIEAMARAGTFLVPSMFLIQQLLGDTGHLAAATEAQMAPIQKDFDNMCRMLPQASAAGVKIVLGDDYGVIVLPHGRYAEELEFYVKTVGITPLEVLRWATANGAELIGMGAELGTVEPGKLADLLIVDGDPSIDIAVLQDRAKLQAILKGGRLVKDELPGS
jgi:imidazolonepropionase-like amidohydrolase